MLQKPRNFVTSFFIKIRKCFHGKGERGKYELGDRIIWNRKADHCYVPFKGPSGGFGL